MGKHDKAREELKNAREALKNHKGDREDAEYQKLNRRVQEAENNLPWHRR